MDADRCGCRPGSGALLSLGDPPREYRAISGSPELRYLTRVLELCPRDGRVLLVGIGNALAAIWLSRRGREVEAIDPDPAVVERARCANAQLGGRARFRVGHLRDLPAAEPFEVVASQGLLEHYDPARLQAALAAQVASARWVVFSVPSVYYPFEPANGDERLLPREEWVNLLAAFEVAELDYYGDPRLDGREHLLGVVHGQQLDDPLRALLTPPAEPYPFGISAIVHTRNEEGRLADALASLQGWTDELIVCDMESTDGTLSVASRYGALIVPHPRIDQFDRARSVSAMRARYRWLFYLDADERVPPRLGPVLRQMVTQHGDEFEAVAPPFRHHFAGQWLRCLYPGYTSPRLFKQGRFHFRARLHGGAEVDGRVVHFPAGDPELAIIHHSYDSLAHYLEKLNRYTDGEAATLDRFGQRFGWRQAIGDFVRDLQGYYDHTGAHRDGVHGLLYSFLGGFYRFEQHAKLYERRYREGRLEPAELEVPGSVEELLEHALAVVRQRPLARAVPPRLATGGESAAQLLWSGPLDDPSGYGEESRQFALGLDETGASVAIQSLPWGTRRARPRPAEAAALAAMAARPVASGFVQVIQQFPPDFLRHPAAALLVGRTMFETDRLPADWVTACNQVDAVWVPSDFNRATFAAAGVDPAKLAVIPGCLDPDPYRALPRREPNSGGQFEFLSIFDWTSHKGWDVLLQAFLEAFERRDDVVLTLKVWSTLGYDEATIQAQAAGAVRERLGLELSDEPRVRFRFDYLSPDELLALYRQADAFVLPSRGEGWGRPYLEAMACGLPTIGTRWSGNLAFMDDANSYLIDCTVTDVPEDGWREIPTYRGHRWAEPSLAHLKTLLQQVVGERDDAVARGNRAREEVLEQYDRRRVASLIVAEIAALNETHARRAATPPAPAPAARPHLAVRWEGAHFARHSLAHVNREFCLELLNAGVEVSLVPIDCGPSEALDEPRYRPLAGRAFAPLSRPAQVHVRHCFPPRFESPPEGHLVLIQPWEYGYLPLDWLDPIRTQVADVWCYSNYVRDVYLASGIPSERLQVVPLGVDARCFCPEAPPFAPTSEPGASRLRRERRRPFVFGFCGGTIERKGIDILLAAYRQAFTSLDDVLLLIKDIGSQDVYRGQNYADRILALVDEPGAPPIVYLDAGLSAAQLAGVFTAIDCLVTPYRGEGFLLPALEAMACGRPVVVPAGGPTDDFVDEQVGWLLPAERKPLAQPRVGPWELCGPGWQFEVSPAELARLMRAIVAEPAEAARRGAAGRERVVASWTWQHSHQVQQARLEALAERPVATAATSEPGPSAAGRPAVRDRRRVVAGAQRPTLSLAMIVRDEERVLDACLKSVRPHVDELIVVDTGSTDLTVAIAESHGAQVHHFPWRDDFSAARNESLRHARGDWVFWMDADDVLPEACGKRLREVILQAEDRTLGLLMQVHCPPPPGESGLTVVDHVKLFRRLPELQFEGRIHEQILESIRRAGGEVERTDLYVVHAGYDHSPAGQQRKRERDLHLLELDLADRPDHPFVLFNLGMTAFHLREWNRATAFLERCLAASGPRESTVRKVYAMLAGCALEQGDRDGARSWAERGLALYPHDPELLFRAGIIHRESGELAAAEACYLRLLTARESGHIDSLDVTLCGFKAHHNLALVYADLGRWEQAAGHWREAVAQAPEFIASWRGLREALSRLGRGDEVQAVEARLAELTAPPQGYGRGPTMDQTLAQLAERGGRTIVELGSIRQRGNVTGDGYSTVAWAQYAARHDGHVYSVDIDPAATALTREETAAWGSVVSAVTADGHGFLREFNQPIDLLYLDALDAFCEGSANWHQAAFRLAEPHLHEASLVLIDDTDQPHRGKGALVIPDAESRGWEVLLDGPQQVLLGRPTKSSQAIGQATSTPPA